ncbi:MAG: hypothetical protein CVV02_17310 [Firmicutes bacterium HGW-Firmicutes-7]|nr:MAG: hypothetical protein CVV02_17310 [Firmicutes bacterium HGW-Firmicutes-7]
MKKYIIIFVIIASISLIGVRVYNKIIDSKPTEVETDDISVEGEEVRKGTISDYAIMTGTIEAEQTVSIMTTVPAIVQNISVEVGDQVAIGEQLFQLETDNVQNQVTQANASLVQANLGVKNAEASAQQAQTSYDMAKANYDMNYEKYVFSRENLANYEKLYNEGVISETEFKQIKLQASESTLELLKKQLEQAAQLKTQAMIGIENAKATVSQAQAGYSTASTTLEDTTFTAPIEGFVSTINVVENMYASSAQPAMIIHKIDRVVINVNVTETIVNKLARGQEVEVEISSLGDKVFTGVLKTVSPAADLKTMLYAVTVELNNENHEIKPGMFANVKLRTEEIKDALHVKGGAISFEAGKNYVYIEQENNTIARKEVELGIDNGDFVEIRKGLVEKDVYIYKGVGFLEEDSIITMVRGDK